MAQVKDAFSPAASPASGITALIGSLPTWV
jgi:hypothetical protein